MDYNSRFTPKCYFKPSYWHQVSTEPYLPLTIGQLIGQAAEQWGDDEAVVYPHEHLRMLFKDIKEKEDEIASGLLNLGLNPGDILAIWGFNCSAMYLISVAAQRAGLIAAYINPNVLVQEVLTSLKKVKAKAFVIIETKDTEQSYNKLVNTITEVSSCTKDNSHSVELPDLRRIITSSDTLRPGTIDWKQVFKMPTTDDIVKINDLQQSVQPDDVAMIMFTSGSTSDPKALLLSHHMLVNNSYFVGKGLGYNNKHRIHSASQFCYLGTILISFLSSFNFGLTSIYSNGRFNIESTINAMQTERCSMFFAIPTCIIDIMRYVQDNHLNLQFPEIVLTAGAGITKKLVEEVKKVFPIKYMMTLYGLSECGCLTFNENVQPGSAMTGKLFDHLEAKIVDNEGKMVPMGMPGELWIRSSCMMKGYLDDEEKTAETITSDGWLKTADQCSLGEDGTWTFLGRFKDRISKYGYIIYPMEIENILFSHNSIHDACVFGVPDERLEEEICAFIQTKKGRALTEDEVIKFCEEKMANYMVPKYIRFIEDIPKNTNGKVNKRALLDVIMKDKNYIQTSESIFKKTEKIN